MENKPTEMNLFMMCRVINCRALARLSEIYHIRPCRRDELNLWKAMPFDDEKSAREANSFMTKFYNEVYGQNEDLFFQECLFVCDWNDRPVATCFAWKAYDRMTTLHWFKVIKAYEGSGIGRALLSQVMRGIARKDYPVFLHTQPSSFRAIKLYTDFGFAFLTDPVIGYRKNDLAKCLPILKDKMPRHYFRQIQFAAAPDDFLHVVKSTHINQF